MGRDLSLVIYAVSPMRNARGFTLVEVLIAMAITAFVAMVAYTSLATVMSSVETLTESGDRSLEVNRAWTFISRDLRDFAPRPLRDEFGQVQPAMVGGELAEFPLSFTRAGWHNPNGHPRSNLQRINYRLEEEALWRDTYFVLDRDSDSEPQSVRLLDDVLDLQVLFLGDLQALDLQNRGTEIDPDNWEDNWIDTTFQQGQVRSPPVAIRITLQLDDWGEMSRYYAIPPY